MRRSSNGQLRRAVLAVSIASGLAACGSGAEPDSAAGAASSSAVEKARRTNPPPPPPPPPPVDDSVLAPVVDITQPGAVGLASANAAGTPLGGSSCGLSADGNLVAFQSTANGLVSSDTNNVQDVFIKDLRTGAIKRVSPSTGASCIQMTPSAGHVLMSDPQGVLMLRTVATNALVTVTPSATSISNNQGFAAGSVSDDGSRVAFITVPTTTYVGAYNWVNNVPARIMVRDLSTGSLQALDTDNGRVADGDLGFIGTIKISPDGRKMLFSSTYAGLVAGDIRGTMDVFVRDLSGGTTQLVSSTSSGALVTSSQQYLNAAWVNSDLVQFQPSASSNLGPLGAYVKQLSTGQLTLALAQSDGDIGKLSADGQRMAFTRLYSGFDRRVFVRNLATGQEKLVSASVADVASNGNSGFGGISANGTRVLFHSNASNLFSPVPPSGSYQLYLKNLGGY